MSMPTWWKACGSSTTSAFLFSETSDEPVPTRQNAVVDADDYERKTIMLGLWHLLQWARNVNRRISGTVEPLYLMCPPRRRARTAAFAQAAEVLDPRQLLSSTLLGQQVFPLDNAWNQNISNAPVAANSAAVSARS